MVVLSEAPSELDAEQALIGSVLLVPHLLTEARWLVGAADFYRPTHQHLWQAIVDLHGRGEPVDRVTVAHEARATVPDAATVLFEAQNTLPASSRWRHYVEMVIRASTSRRLILLASEAAQNAYTADDPFKLVATLTDDLAALGRSAGTVPTDLMSADAIAAQGDADMPPWLVPGWLYHGDRTIIVAEEGVGKSVLTMQWAMMIAQGVNPMWPTERHVPCTTLVIDLENPRFEVRARIRQIKAKLQPRLDYNDDLCQVWHRPSGIDLRARSTARELEAVLLDVKPSLVVLGPLYKAFRREARENDEQAAAPVQEILDDFRARFGFAVVIEHHAPKGSSGVRDLVPFGSSLWQRWPEFGLALKKVDDQGIELQVNRFRGDRRKNPGWPTHLSRGLSWPWEATYRGDPHPWGAPGA